MSIILRICGIGVILYGVILGMSGFVSDLWNPGQRIFAIGHGLASLIIGIGVVRLSKIAVYFVFPLAFYTFWVMRFDLAQGNQFDLIFALVFATTVICSVIYLFQSQSASQK